MAGDVQSILLDVFFASLDGLFKLGFITIQTKQKVEEIITTEVYHG